jgi:purine-binding chemotaxis protein CheW
MVAEASGAAQQYLSFTLDQEPYALDISRVREVLEHQPITRIPRTPEFFKGILNLRGSAVPVVDLRRKFGMPATKTTVNTCIIIVEVTWEGERIVLGALADSVREVFELAEEQIVPPPRMGTLIRPEYIQGMGRAGNRFIVVLNVDALFSGEELALVKAAAQEAPPPPPES